MRMAVDQEMLEELRKIRELLTKPPDLPKPKGFWPEFKAFLAEYKVLGLAVAFILGLYLGNVVKALVSDLLLPVVDYGLPAGTDFNTFKVGPFGLGDFINNVLTFLIVALVIFLIVKLADKYKIA
jgi:large conductance mechanosensitive channel